MTDSTSIRIGPLVEWNPRHFVVAHLVVDDEGTVTGFDLERSGVYLIKGLEEKLRTIENFSEAVSVGIAPLDKPTIRFPDESASSPVFPVRGPCYVIFALDTPWSFAQAGTGVFMPLGADTRYADLYQVPKSGSPVRGRKFEGSGCTVAYFSAKTAANSHKTHTFHINAERSGRNHRVVTTTLDPDIKNDGTSPQWP